MNEKKIIDYKILCHFDAYKLEEVVKDFIARGWQPLHGFSCRSISQIESDFDDEYCQPMVRYENP